MSTVIKKSLSFDVDVATRLEQMAKKKKKSFSGLVNDAASDYLQKLEEEALGKAYRQFYADPKNRKEADQLIEDFAPLVEETWPEW